MNIISWLGFDKSIVIAFSLSQIQETIYEAITQHIKQPTLPLEEFQQKIKQRDLMSQQQLYSLRIKGMDTDTFMSQWWLSSPNYNANTLQWFYFFLNHIFSIDQ